MLIPAPPILRRVFSSSPLLAPLLLVLVVVTLILSASPTARKHTLPSSWRGVASPPAADEDLTPLPPLYAASLPGLQLPAQVVRYPALASRLHDFLLRPLESAPVAAKTNHETCPLPIADLIVNQDQLEGNRDFWGNLTTGDIAEHRAALVNWLAAQADAGAEIVGSPTTGSGRGIVITAGNQVSGVGADASAQTSLTPPRTRHAAQSSSLSSLNTSATSSPSRCSTTPTS